MKNYYRRLSWGDGCVTQQGIVIKVFDDNEVEEVKPGVYSCGDHLYAKVNSIKENK
jgi:hypothetical protein